MTDAQPYSRDRTQEFQSIAETLKNSSSSSSLPLQFEFNERASKIGMGIHQTSQMLAILARLANRRSVFDDPTREIEELSALINQDITALNSAVVDLQRLCNTQNGSWNVSTAASRHYTEVIVDNLKNRLIILAEEFKVLTMRTEVQKLKADETRRQLYHPPWVNGASSSSTLFSRIGEEFEDMKRRRLANVDGAPNQLVRYLNSISPNGWLTIKIFFVLMVYLMIFLIFVK